jgi:hypothetical protein
MFYRLLMVACLLAPFSADALDAPADLVPAGLNVGDQFYVVFTTSTYPQATSTLISFYNSYVQGVAAASMSFPSIFDHQGRLLRRPVLPRPPSLPIG